MSMIQIGQRTMQSLGGQDDHTAEERHLKVDAAFHPAGTFNTGWRRSLFPRGEGAIRGKAVPGGEDEAGGAVFAVLADFLLLEDGEGRGGEAGDEVATLAAPWTLTLIHHRTGPDPPYREVFQRALQVGLPIAAAPCGRNCPDRHRRPHRFPGFRPR